jgi:hypothetical protein
MFLTVADYDHDGDLDVVDCTSTGSQGDSRITIHRNQGNWLSWNHETLPPMTNVGHCQSVVPVPGGLAVSTWKGNTYPVPEPDASKSGVYWMRDDGGGTWTRGEVSGPQGGKWDNLAPDGACLVTSEQLDPQGGLGVVRLCPPWVLP